MSYYATRRAAVQEVLLLTPIHHSWDYLLLHRRLFAGLTYLHVMALVFFKFDHLFAVPSALSLPPVIDAPVHPYS